MKNEMTKEHGVKPAYIEAKNIQCWLARIVLRNDHPRLKEIVNDFTMAVTLFNEKTHRMIHVFFWRQDL